MFMDSSDFISISDLAQEGRNIETDWNYALMNYLQKLQTGSREDLTNYYGLYYPFSIEMDDGSFWSWEDDNEVIRHFKEIFYNKLDYGEFKFTQNVEMGEDSKEDYQIEYQIEPVKKRELKLTFNPLYIEMYESAKRIFVSTLLGQAGKGLGLKDFLLMLNDDAWFRNAGWRVHKEYQDGFIDDYYIEHELPEWVNIGPDETYGRSFISYVLSKGWGFNPKLYEENYDINIGGNWLDEKDLLYLSQQVDEIGDELNNHGLVAPGNDPVFATTFYEMMELYYHRGEIYEVNPLRLFLYAIGETGLRGETRVFSPLEIFRWRHRSGAFMEQLWKDIADGEASFMVFIRDFYTDEHDEYPTYGNQSISLDIINYESRKMILNNFISKYVFLPDFIGFKQNSRPQTFLNYSLKNAFRKF